MNNRLISLNKRYEELALLIQDPDLVKDQKKYRDTMKEYTHLSEIVTIQNEIEVMKKQLEETETIIREEKDPEMKGLAREEAGDLELKIGNSEEKLKFLLIPRDPLDEKNIIMEIRAGTGGE